MGVYIFDGVAVAALLLILRQIWLMERQIRWHKRRARLLRERRWRTETFPDWHEVTLRPGERLVDGKVMYSAGWLDDKPTLRVVQ